MNARQRRVISRLITSLIMIPITYLIHIISHTVKVHGPALMAKIKKRQQ